MRERIVRAVAGSFVLVSILLAHFVSMNWLWLGVFVGVNLLQSGFTKFCPLEKILNAIGGKEQADKIFINKGNAEMGG
ncbi:MAG: DUF2892 domain-containing protein, partial [Bacteroidota bacterium]|nr:DUF2892 domain-containing protein [Bacteroidota bacterium]